MTTFVSYRFAFVGLFVIFLTSSLQTAFAQERTPLTVIDPSLLRTLPDRGGGLGLELDIVEGELAGQKVAGARLKYVHKSSPFYNTEWGKGTIIWAIDSYLFSSAADMAAYIRSIPPGKKTELRVQAQGSDKPTSLTVMMPAGVRVPILAFKASVATFEVLNCKAKQIWEGVSKNGTSKTFRCNSAGATIDDLKQEAIALHKELLATPGNDNPQIRKDTRASLQKLLSEK